MPYQRKYDFQPGTKISSSQVDEEFDNLITAANELENTRYSKTDSELLFAKSQQEAWNTVILQNGWTNYAADWVPARYRKNSVREVEVEAFIKGGVITAGTLIGVLPDGYRPSHNMKALGFSFNGANFFPSTVTIGPDGTIKAAENVQNTWFTFSAKFLYAY